MSKFSTLLLLLLFVSVFSKSEYKVVSKTQTSTNITLQLEYFGKDQYYLKTSSPMIKKPQFEIRCLAYGEFYFKITDSQNKRFQILTKSEPFPQDIYDQFSFPILACGIDFTYNQNPFDFRIVKSNSKVVLFSTLQSNFIFSNYYIQIGTEVASDKIFGLGERFSVNFRKDDGKWTVFNRAGDQEIDHGTGNNTYGYYPFYLLIDNKLQGHINYLKSTNAMDVFKSQNNQKHYLTYKVVGGILNFRFSLGYSDIVGLVKKFQTNIIGKSAIPPFWSLGFHQSRWGYESVETLREVIGNYKSYGLPLDTIWSDIDYMDQLKDFTVDPENYPQEQLKKITDEYHYVPIVDAGVAKDSEAYEIGKQMDVFIKDLRGKEYKGLVWPGDTAFVDYFHPNATKYWMEMLDKLYQKVKFSGIWLDMNEIQNFCDGPCEVYTQPAIIDYSNDIPYHPGSHLLEYGTISLNVTHYGNISEFNVHPYFPLMQIYATNKYLKTKSKFPFILSRSTTFGSNQYGFHWTGDNHASWQFLRSSVVDNMNMNLAGIQMVGPDICGFGGDTNEQLCARWYQLSAVYPFARSHNDYWSIPQQPYSLGQRVLTSAFSNLKLRYCFLKQFYTYLIDDAGAVPFFTSLAFYPEALKDITNITLYDSIVNSQFLISNNSFLVAPILQPNTTVRDVFLPDLDSSVDQPEAKTKWTNILTGTVYQSGMHKCQPVQLDTYLPMYIAAGSSYMIHNVSSTTKTSQLNGEFILLSSYKFVVKNKDISTYISEGSILSINDYDDQDKIQVCLGIKSKYNIYQRLDINFQTKHFDLNIKTSSTNSVLRDPISIISVMILVDGLFYTYVLPSPIKIRENINVTIPLDFKSLREGNDAWSQIIGRPSSMSKNLLTE